MSVVDSPAHRALAKVAAQKSMVLLENRGRAAAGGGREGAGGGGADGRRRGGAARQLPRQAVARGDDPGRHPGQGRGARRERAIRARRAASPAGRRSGIAGAVEAVRRPEVGVAVVVLGLSPRYEGEEKDSLLNPGGDRRDLALPGVQQRLLEAVVAVGKPTVLVLTGGGALGFSGPKSHVPRDPDGLVPGRGGRFGGRRRAVRRRESRGAAAGHVLPIDRRAAAVRGLPHGGPHLSLFPRRADIRVRLRPQLHDVPLWRGGGRRPRTATRRRRSRSA